MIKWRLFTLNTPRKHLLKRKLPWYRIEVLRAGLFKVNHCIQTPSTKGLFGFIYKYVVQCETDRSVFAGVVSRFAQ